MSVSPVAFLFNRKTKQQSQIQAPRGISSDHETGITSATSMEFSEAWKNRVTGNYGDIPAYFISNADLILNKPR